MTDNELLTIKRAASLVDRNPYTLRRWYLRGLMNRRTKQVYRLRTERLGGTIFTKLVWIRELSEQINDR